MGELFRLYLKCIGATECPIPYHRWTLLGVVASLLRRRHWVQFGERRIYPNLYTIIIGSPGTRRSTALSLGSQFLAKLGINEVITDTAIKDVLWRTMARQDPPHHIFLIQDDFGRLITSSEQRFPGQLSDVYENPPFAKLPIRGGGRVDLEEPCVNILAATSHANLHKAFRNATMDTGLLSRCILVNDHEVKVRVPWPDPLEPKSLDAILDRLSTILDAGNIYNEPMEITREAKDAIALIYMSQPTYDINLGTYGARRQILLLKICLILSAISNDFVINEEHVVEANTILYKTEVRMPQALGEFGRGRYSDANQLVLNIVQDAQAPLSAANIYRQVSAHYDGADDLNRQLANLVHGGKIQRIDIPGKFVLFAGCEDVRHTWPSHLLDYTLLTEEENPDVLLDLAVEEPLSNPLQEKKL